MVTWLPWQPLCYVNNVSVNSKPGHPHWVTPRDSHIPVAQGVGFSLFCFAQGSAWGVCSGGLKSKYKLDNFEKSVIFAVSLKQLSSSSFHMFTYARSEQCDFVPNYTITNTQCVRIFPVIKIQIYPGQNFIGSRTKKTKL